MEHLSQSVVGLASSDLQGLNWLELETWFSSMVMKSSVSLLFQSLSVMVRMLDGYFLFTSLMMWKNSSEKYGGAGLVLQGHQLLPEYTFYTAGCEVS